LPSISDRVLDRELAEAGEAKRERIIGRRLKEGYAHYRRYLEILNALSRNGFGYVFDKIKSANVFPKLEGADEGKKNYAEARRLKLVFEELGPTFIKIGQILSTRPDLVPEEYIAELSTLKTRVAPLEFEVVRERIETELGMTLTDAFSGFEKVPIGAASIGQVHKATTKAGKKVAVKVQRPGVKKKVMVDMEILEDLADAFGALAGISSVIDPVEMVRELKRLLTREIDYTVEARSIEHFKRDFEGVPDIIIPGVHWELTTKRVLTMDYITGIPVDEIENIKSAGVDPKKVAGAVGTAVARMIFVKGYFHGDPHGGNILVQKTGKIALLDFGSVGYIDAKMRDKIRLFYFSISRENVTKAVELFLDICAVSEKKLNLPALEQDFREFLDYQKLVREGRKVSEGMNQRLISIALKHEFAPPTPFILLERALLLAEGVCRSLAADFDFNQMLMPVLGDVIRDKTEEALDPVGALQTAQAVRELRREGPKKIMDVLDKLDAGEIVIKAEVPALNELRRDVWRIMGVVALSIVAMILLFMVTYMGISLNTPFLNVSIPSASIVIIWLVGVWFVMRRWKGPA